MPEYLDNGLAGMLAEPGDHEGLAQSLITLAKDKSLRARLGHYGRERVERLYTRRKISLLTVELYEEAIRLFSEGRKK
jgi:glycosyltransferase involved in cell wall biosynthesis